MRLNFKNFPSKIYIEKINKIFVKIKQIVTCTNENLLKSIRINNDFFDKKEDFARSMAVNIPGNKGVCFVDMRVTVINNSKDYLIIYGLGPCVGVAIVIKSNTGKITRLLSHIDMGDIFGYSTKCLAGFLKIMKENMSDGISNIEISLSSTDSYNDLKNLKEKEKKLVNIILSEFEDNGITPEDINYNYARQVQIAPDGRISTYSEVEKKFMTNNIIRKIYKGILSYIEPNLNIYITKYGAWMGNCDLKRDTNEEEKNQYLKEYYQEKLENGYKLKIAPAFNKSHSMAIYLENWKDKRLRKKGGIPGCRSAT